jgi:hypothetical protein
MRKVKNAVSHRKKSPHAKRTPVQLRARPVFVLLPGETAAQGYARAARDQVELDRLRHAVAEARKRGDHHKKVKHPTIVNTPTTGAWFVQGGRTESNRRKF